MPPLVSPLSPSEWSALFLLITVTSFTPGPNTAISAAMGVNHGWRNTLGFISAVPVGCGIIYGLCALGVGGLVVQRPELRTVVLLAGVAYLLWLAQRLWRTQHLGEANGGLKVGFKQGVVLQFLNIKVWMLELSIVAGWLAGQAEGLARFLWTLPVVLGYAFLSNFSYAMVGSALRHWLAQGQRLLWFNRSMASALALTAAWMIQGLT
jgi:threonine/homoserine/homoserine lactone efflux protein